MGAEEGCLDSDLSYSTMVYSTMLHILDCNVHHFYLCYALLSYLIPLKYVIIPVKLTHDSSHMDENTPS